MFINSTIKSSGKKFSMKYINRYIGILLFIFGVYFFINFSSIFTYNKPETPYDIIDSFETLKLKIDFLQNLVDTKQNDINNLKEAFVSNVRYYNNLVEKQKKILDGFKNRTTDLFADSSLKSLLDNNSSNLTQEEQFKSLLKRLSLSINENGTSLSRSVGLDVDFPQVIEFLPHLTGRAHLVQPKFKQSKNRFASLVIGIPTIKREKTAYLLETLKSLFDAMNDLEKSEVLVVVMIAEMEDPEFVQHTIKTLNQAYKFEIDTGLLDIIVPPTEFYPGLNNLGIDRVFNDSRERVKWRTKQNYDFSYLMTYSQKRAVYYLQLEDDVVSKTGFYSIIKNFIHSQKSDQWMMIEFSQLGFIGKLFKCHDLSMFVNFFLMFSADKPCDWLYDSVFTVKICNPEKGDTHCERSKNELKIRYKPSLFQHVGVQSSLKGKTQKLKDKDFGKNILIVSHQNPAAKVSTSLKTYMKYSLESAYLGQNFFWSMNPSKNDHILFEFNKPATLYRYYVKSGNPEHPDDKLYNSTFQIKTLNRIANEKLPSSYLELEDGFYKIDDFSNELGSVSGLLDPNVVGEITKVRIQIPNPSETWIIVSEIDFSQKPIDNRSRLISLIQSSQKVNV